MLKTYGNLGQNCRLPVDCHISLFFHADYFEGLVRIFPKCEDRTVAMFKYGRNGDASAALYDLSRF